MIKFQTLQDLIELAEKRNGKISSVILEYEAAVGKTTPAAVLEQMEAAWQVMEDAMQTGLTTEVRSRSGLVGGDARKLAAADAAGKLMFGGTMTMAVARALAVAEVNAAMGKIVAAPTAGSCGIIPGALFTGAEAMGAERELILQALLTSAGIGLVIAHQASISGAAGGCQAECGSASAMAAGALVELGGGSPKAVGHAVAIALKNVLGLVCDPVAGLVEVPCVKRNAMAVANAMVAADMALAGITSVIPADEVIIAMGQIGKAMPTCLRETSQGGLAITPTGCSIAGKLAAGKQSNTAEKEKV